MQLPDVELVCLVDDQVGLEGHVERDEDAEVGKSSDVAKLEGPDPLQDSSVLIDHLALLEVQGLTGVLGRHFNEGLVEIGGVVDVLFKFEEAIDGGTEELRMTETVRDILVLLLGLDCHVVLVALAVVIVASNGAVEALSLPLDDVFELGLLVPGGVGDEAVLVLEGPTHFLGDFATGESEIGQIRCDGTIGVDVGVDAGNAAFVGAV